MDSNTAVRVENLCYAYPDGTVALRSLSFSLAQGERVALIGPNGAGKSTALLHLNGILQAQTGKVWIDQLLLQKDSLAEIRRRVGLVFQDPNDQLFSPTVGEDVAFAPLNFGLPEEEVKRRVQRALAGVGLEGYESKSPFHMSVGEKKRVSLATVLAQEPTILVLDEPASHLDPKSRRFLVEWLRSFQGTLIVATHDLGFVREVCSRTILLNQGRLVADGPMETILGDGNLLTANDLEWRNEQARFESTPSQSFR